MRPEFPANDVDDVDDDSFLAAILDMEAEERRQLGLLGRWPLWEIRQWAILHPEAAERRVATGIVAAGVALGTVWHVLAGWYAGR